MLNILQVEDRLKDMSEDSVKRIVVDPNPSVPAFLAVNELNRRDRIKKDYQMSQQEDRPTVAEQLVTGAGMPAQAVSDMAMTMAPQSNVAGNTGLEAMMPQRATPEEMPSEEEQDVMLMEDEEPLGMSYGGLSDSRAMKEGGIASMSNGGMLPRQVKARPLEPPRFLSGIGKAKRDEWDKQYGALYNNDGSLKEEYRENPPTGDFFGEGSLGTFGSIESDGESSKPVNNSVVPPPPPPADTGVGSSSFDSILKMIQEDRDSAKMQRNQDKNLALLQFGLNLAKRGMLEDTGEGLKTLAMSNKAYQDQLAKLRGLDVQTMLTKENIVGRQRAAETTAEAALKKALAKSQLDEKELSTIISGLRKDIFNYRKTISGSELDISDTDKAQAAMELRRALEQLNRYQAELEGIQNPKDVTSDIYPEDGE